MRRTARRKILDLPTLQLRLGPLRDRGKRVVLTNGCFDLLHVGHVRYLEAARRLGDVLVVGVNSDASVASLKPDRPLLPQADRAELIASLEAADYVVIFDEPTAAGLVSSLRPDVYCKGGDYREGDLPEANAVRAYGGQVILLPLVEGYSTSGLIRRVGKLPEA